MAYPPQPDPYPQRPEPAPQAPAHLHARKPPSPRTTLVLIAVAVVAVVAVVVVAVTLSSGSSGGAPSDAAQAGSTTNVEVTADFQAYLSDFLGGRTKPPGTYVTKARANVDGYDLVLDTNLNPQPNVRQAAITICGYGSGYLLARARGGEADGASVKVNDRTGQVLASSQQGGQCEWRQ